MTETGGTRTSAGSQGPGTLGLYRNSGPGSLIRRCGVSDHARWGSLRDACSPGGPHPGEQCAQTEVGISWEFHTAFSRRAAGHTRPRAGPAAPRAPCAPRAARLQAAPAGGGVRSGRTAGEGSVSGIIDILCRLRYCSLRSCQPAGTGATVADGVRAHHAANAATAWRSVSVSACMSQVTTQVGSTACGSRSRRCTISHCWAAESRSRMMGSTSSSSSSR